ncbi:uncharacterized protein THITE_2113946 [Thermothielavioides terrestris NRRL 8126]|uniref:Sm domain-containing protein n=1 Tax=Thermothielavioides terrestris (strain ATCC 38088 / NRRL 8126) TaxID=578455 RepID=G2R4R7_THETT|nr:uncharacterized protein THITE_2113946 [Thermothielavioides terrestris NRRL 8126]AEO66107.1 hypothetical protein THITE_2113946 [Thermothielavioides terrestris NRRL 8126]
MSTNTSTPPIQTPQKAEATAFLQSLLNKNLRVTTTDNRMFWGAFKCTDSESNIVLEHTYEYRHPTPREILSQAAALSSPSPSTPTTTTAAAAATASSSSSSSAAAQAATAADGGGSDRDGRGGTGTETGSSSSSAGTVTLEMTSRYLGLVVVPGKHIVRIEAEEFASQLRGRQGGAGERQGRGGVFGTAGGEGVRVS